MPNNFNLTNENPWLGFSIDDPQGMFNAFLPQANNYNLNNWLKNQYANVSNKYGAELNRRALRGQPPVLQFYNFLSDYPFLNEYMKMSPGNRGQTRSAGMQWNIPWL